MSVLITGATGLIGSQLTKRLLRDKRFGEVIVMVRNIDKAKDVFGSDFNEIKVIVGDIRGEINCDFDIDYIFHCACVTTSKFMIDHPDETLSIAVDGTRNILEFARKKSVRSVVYLSSMEMYGSVDDKYNPITEDKLGYIDLNNPRSCYPQGKRLAEDLCVKFSNEYGMDVKIARLAQTFGSEVPLDDSRVFMQFAKSAALGKDIVLHTKGQSVLNFCYLQDVIDALIVIMEHGKSGEAYNVCNDSETRTICEIAELVANDVASGKIKVVYDIPADNIYGYAADTKIRLSSEKIRGLGWEPSTGMRDAYSQLVDRIKKES